MPTVKVEDITMYYEFHSEKNTNTLVIIPGLGTDLTVYKEIINQLSKEFKVLAFRVQAIYWELSLIFSVTKFFAKRLLIY